MNKIRRMLGRADQPEIQAIMNLIDTQSKTTIEKWCINYVETNYLPEFECLRPTDSRPRKALESAKDYINGKIKLAEVKAYILDCKECATENDTEPIVLAYIRAIEQGASVIKSPTHALSIAFYGAAAVAYSKVGYTVKPEILDEVATQEFVKIYESLKTVSVPNEPNPVKVKWFC